MPIKRRLIPIGINGTNNYGFQATATENSINAYRAFDNLAISGDATTCYRSGISPTLPGYLTVMFPKKYIINGYDLLLGNVYIQYSNMKEWEFQGLVNGTWITLHSGINATQIIASLTYDIIPVEVAGVRIKCNTRWGSNSWGIDELIVYEYQPLNKHFIKSNNQIFTLSNNQLIDTLLTNLTETDFLSQGFDNLNTLNSSLLSTLPSSEIEILTYTDVNGIESTLTKLAQPQTWEFSEKLFKFNTTEVIKNISNISLT